MLKIIKVIVEGTLMLIRFTSRSSRGLQVRQVVFAEKTGPTHTSINISCPILVNYSSGARVVKCFNPDT